MNSGALSTIGQGEHVALLMPKPANDHILLRITATELETTKGGIVVPANKEVSARCEVLDVGPGTLLPSGQRVGVCCKPGDQILFKGTSIGFVLDGVTYHMIQDNQVFAIVRESRVVS